MLKIQELRFQGIGRFVEEQVLLFSEFGNLIQVDGKNNNTGGSSGAGKTTVFNALDFLLGLNDVSNTILQSRITKDPIKVSGIFEWNGERLEIIRSKKGLRIESGGQITEGSSKLAEEKLDEILGMPRHLFRPMLHKRQKEGGFFLNFTPKEMHEFLTDCLGLTDLTKKIDSLDAQEKLLLKAKMEAEKAIETKTASLLANQNALMSLGAPPVCLVTQDQVIANKSHYDQSASLLQQLVNRHKEEREELEKERPSIQSGTYDRTAWDKYEQDRKHAESRMSTIFHDLKEKKSKIALEISNRSLTKLGFTSIIKQGEVSKSKLQKIAEQLKSIASHTCPTCEQHWNSDSSLGTQNALREEALLHKNYLEQGIQAYNDLAKVEEEIRILQETHTDVEPVNNELIVLNEQIANITSLILDEKQKQDTFQKTLKNSNDAILNTHYVKQQALQSAQESATSAQRALTETAQRILSESVSALKNYEENRQRYEKMYAFLTDQTRLHTLSIDEANVVLNSKIEELLLIEELKKAIKTYTSRSFDEALESIGDAATRIIRNIPNMANATIQLEGLKETKDGKIKEEVNAIISSDGETGIPIKSLSGGERSSVDLAVDLATVDMIESKSGRGIDLFILDEPFTGLDTVSVEMALEVLKNSQINKRIVIVDHNPVIKEMVGNRLIVERDGQTSRLTQ